MECKKIRSAGTQTEVDEKIVLAENIVKNYSKIEKYWKIKEEKILLLYRNCLGLSIGMLCLCCLHWKYGKKM